MRDALLAGFTGQDFHLLPVSASVPVPVLVLGVVIVAAVAELDDCVLPILGYLVLDYLMQKDLTNRRKI